MASDHFCFKLQDLATKTRYAKAQKDGSKAEESDPNNSLLILVQQLRTQVEPGAHNSES